MTSAVPPCLLPRQPLLWCSRSGMPTPSLRSEQYSKIGQDCQGDYKDKGWEKQPNKKLKDGFDAVVLKDLESGAKPPLMNGTACLYVFPWNLMQNIDLPCQDESKPGKIHKHFSAKFPRLTVDKKHCAVSICSTSLPAKRHEPIASDIFPKQWAHGFHQIRAICVRS